MFKVILVDEFEVTIRNENFNISHVYQQLDGKWRCQRCNRLLCEHAKFVSESGVQLLPKKPTPPIDDDEILTY